jgi:membrane protease YdiL (CAAX protease family)
MPEPWASSWPALHRVAAAALFLGLGPALVARVGLGMRLGDLGATPGDVRFGTAALLLGIVALAPILWLGSSDPGLRAEYPMARSLASSGAWGFAAWSAIYLVYYIAWEFHFRGLLLFGLSKGLGTGPAVLLQTVSSTLLHLGKPESETIAALVAGPLFAAMALRARSFLWVIALHWAIGVMNDLFSLVRWP